MGYAGKVELKLKAQSLRRRGLSIKQIEKKLQVSRSSVSLWVRDIKLSRKKLEKLYLNKRTGSLKGSIIAALNKIRRREEMTLKLLKEGKRNVGRLTKRDRFIAGISLYFAEGSKSDDNVSFSNSDWRSILFMMNWLREFCKVSEKKFRCSFYLHDNLDENKAKRFWSKVTGIPLAQFQKTYIVKNRTERFRRTKHEYGVCRITVSNVNLHRKIMGWIEGLFQNIVIPL